MTKQTIPYWRLSGFYFFYFASLGALIPYISLYFKKAGFDALEIGILVGIIPATKIIAPYIIGWLADHSRCPIRIIRWANLFAAILFGFIFFGHTFWWLVWVMASFSFFWNAVLPQFEATTLNHLGPNTHQYSNVRLWGSLGFIVAVLVLGEVFTLVSVNWLVVILSVLLFGVLFASLFVPESPCKHEHNHASILHVIRQPSVLAFLLICFLMLLSHGPYYTFYSIYLENHGYSSRIIGFMWATGVIAEIIVFILLPRFYKQTRARSLLLITFALTALRWLLIGFFPQYLTVLFFAQLLHAFSFGMFHAVSIMLVHQYFRGIYQGRGQALYASLSFGVGGAVGSLVSGLLWSTTSPQFLFTLAAMVALLAWFIVWRFMQPELVFNQVL